MVNESAMEDVLAAIERARGERKPCSPAANASDATGT